MEINKIYPMDCFEGLEKMKDESIDCIITDPPFNSETKMASPFRPDSNAKMSEEEWFIYNNMSSRGYISWMNRIFKELNRVLKKGSHLYVFCNWKNIRNTMDILEANFFILKDLLVWDKEHFGIGFNYRPQTEFILFVSKDKPKRLNSKGQANLFRFKRLYKAHSLVQKPVGLIQKLVEMSSNEGELILDPFMGTGTTAIASRNIGRKFIGFELNKRNYAECERRLNEPIQETLTQKGEKN